MADKRRDKGMGSYRQKPNGTWEGRYKGAYCFAKTEAEIKKRLKTLVQQVDNKGQLDENNILYAEARSDTEIQSVAKEDDILFTDWLDKWMKDYKKLKLKASTFSTYSFYIGAYVKPNMQGYILSGIKAEHIQNLLSKLTEDGLKASTVAKVKNIISNALKQAESNKIIPYNPAQATVAPRIEQEEIRVFTVEEQKRFLEAIKGNRLEALFITALGTGMRRGELFALKWDNVDFDRKEILITGSISRFSNDKATAKTSMVLSSPKTKTSRRRVPMLGFIEESLLAHKEKQEKEKEEAGSAWNDNNIVFSSIIGTYVEPNRVKIYLDNILKAAGIEHINFHALRHTFATRMLENGASIKALQEILGHAKPSTTLNVYGHLIGSTAHDEVSKISNLFGTPAKTEQEKSEPEKPRQHKILLLNNKRSKGNQAKEQAR